MSLIRDLPAFSRPYRHGVRFDKPDGEEDAAAQIKRQVEEQVAQQRKDFKAAEDRMNRVTSEYADAKKALAAKPVPRPQNQSDGEDKAAAWADRVMNDFTEDEDFTAAQTKKIMNFGRSIAQEVIGVSKKEAATAGQKHASELATVKAQLEKYTKDPGRVFEDVARGNPSVLDGVNFEQVPAVIKARAKDIISKEIETDPVTAIKVAFGEVGAKLYMDSEAEKLSDAEAAEGLPVSHGGGAVEIDPTSVQIPANPWDADLEDFFELADGKEVSA